MNVEVNLPELKAAASAHAAKDSALEREAITLYNSIPVWARTAAMRDFLRRLADHLNWQHLKGIMK